MYIKRKLGSYQADLSLKRGKPALDNDGNVYYQMLAKNDE